MKKFIALAVLSAVLLAGCEKNPAEVTEQVSVTEASVTEITSAAEVSESETSESASVTAAEVTSVVTETEPPYIEDGKPPAVMAAEELYDTYPVKLIYPERQDVSDKVKTEILQEDIYNSDGLLMVKFYAEYPVISGYDEAVCKRINDEIHGYIYGIFEKEKEWAEEYNADDLSENAVYKEYGFFSERKINIDGTFYDGDGCDINGSIFTVYFAANGGFAGSIYHEYPAVLLFDLRSGERIYFSDLVEDKDGISVILGNALWDFQFKHGEVPCGKLDADKYSGIAKMKGHWIEIDDGFGTYLSIAEPDEQEAASNITNNGFGVDEDGNLLVVYENADDRMTIFDGCVSFYLRKADYGDTALGIERVDIPAKEIVPYLNEKGKSLFEGYVSADSEPPKVIEYKGKRWFDNVEWIPEFIDRKNLTDYDREFISMFENARNAGYYLGRE